MEIFGLVQNNDRNKSLQELCKNNELTIMRWPYNILLEPLIYMSISLSIRLNNIDRYK